MDEKERLIKAVDYAIESDYDAWNIQCSIREKLKNCNRICLYGAGKFLADNVKMTNVFGFCCNNIIYVCDNDSSKYGTYIETGLYENQIMKAKVISFNELKMLKDIIVIVTVGNPKDIQKQLKANGIENYKLGDLILNVYTEHYPGTYFQKNKTKIPEVFDLLADKKSKEIYTEVICNRIAPHLASKTFDEIYEENEYFTTGIIEFDPENEYIVDCGAYIGDSLNAYMKLSENKVGKYYCFELNKETADICQRNIENYKSDRIELIRAGVSDKNEEIEVLNSGANMSVKLSDILYTGDTAIKNQIVKLDDILRNEPVTFIKMDIEGEEIAALGGGKNIIEKYLPKLAISAYHILSDLWEIPLLISSYSKSYRIYYRHHTPTVADTDCYAVVK